MNDLMNKELNLKSQLFKFSLELNPHQKSQPRRVKTVIIKSTVIEPERQKTFKVDVILQLPPQKDISSLA